MANQWLVLDGFFLPVQDAMKFKPRFQYVLVLWTKELMTSVCIAVCIAVCICCVSNVCLMCVLQDLRLFEFGLHGVGFGLGR